MKFKKNNSFISGVAIPLGAINTLENTGSGEFADLVQLSQWCIKTGFTVIQILPIYDTGLNPSPYSALSGFALNPIYLKIIDIEYGDEYEDDINKFRKRNQNSKTVAYKDIYNFKIDLLKKIYSHHQKDILNQPELQKWIERNDWIHVYSAFKILSERNGTIVWSNWTFDPVFNENTEQKFKQLQEFIKLNHDQFYLYSWIQFLLEKQLMNAVKEMDRLGINLKGDLPVLIDKESSDVWFHRDLFNLNRVAGAPPDQFSTNGQNWGFPVYNFENMEKDHFNWWKKRISRLNYFYHAIRLDHIIGFMRLWQFPRTESRALMGFFSPSDYICMSTLIEKKIDMDEIKNLSKAAIDVDHLDHINKLDNKDYFQKTYLVFSPLERLFYLTEKIKTEASIDILSESEQVKELIKEIYINRIFLEVSIGNYAPLWGFENTNRFHNLANNKKESIQNLVHEYYKQSEKIWYDHGKNFLFMLQKESDALFCGEDLGVVPPFTQCLLEELGILSLKVLRWTRYYNEQGSPFIEPKNYPGQSVATTSVHDSENLRQWWRDDINGRNSLMQMINRSEKKTDDAPAELTPDLALQLLKWFFTSASEIVMLPIQDIFSIEERYRIVSLEEERINIPGLVLESNWVYKMPCMVETLIEDINFNEKILSITKIRLTTKEP